MKTRFLIIIAMVGVALIFTIPQTFALSCGTSLFTESYDRHDLLLHGKLYEKELLFPASENQKTTNLTFDTIKVYKGEFSKTFTIKANLVWDDYYREGEEYVLFADKAGDGYLRELCVPDYLATPSIIKFLDQYSSENLFDSEVRSLYEVVQGFEIDDLETRMNVYSSINRAEVEDGAIGSGYVVETDSYDLTWFGALQIIIIGALVGIPIYLIYKKKNS